MLCQKLIKKELLNQEPDLLKPQQLINWADHLVWVYPVWWGSVPTIMIGFIDRIMLPGFAYKKWEGSLWWDKYLKGKTARIICTIDQPGWYYRLYYGGPSNKAMKKLTMQFVGVRKVRISQIGPIRLSTDSFRSKWINKIRKQGELFR